MQDKFGTFLRVTFVLGWLIVSLYFGISGYLTVDLINLKEKAESAKMDTVRVKDTTYDNKYEFLFERDTEIVNSIFPYLTKTTEPLALLITALAFGALGGVTQIFKQVAFEKVAILEIKVFYIPVLGMLTGIFVLGISYVIPTILVSGDQSIRPETLVFLALFSGLFSQRFYEWLNTNFDNIFRKTEK